MANCQDFSEEPSAMQSLFLHLSQQSESNIVLLTSPKYHCEIAGEGIEYDWGLTKKKYRNIPLSEKNSKEKFSKCVKQCIKHVTKAHVRLFSGKCHRYMMAYKNIANTELAHDSIERFVKKTKTHRNIQDSDKGFITSVWKKNIIDLT